jgi:cell division protein FtsB
MENQRRRLEPLIKWDELLKKKPYTANKFTLMLMGRLGKARSLQISFWPLVWVLTLTGVYLLVSFFIICDYIRLRQQTHSQRIHIAQLTLEADQKEKAIAELKQDNALLSDYVQSQEDGTQKIENKLLLIAAIKKSEIKPTAPAPIVKPAEQKPKAEPPAVAALVPPVPKKESIDVQDLSVKKDGSLLNITLKLVNLSAQDNATMVGYLHLIGLNRQGGDPSRTWTYPYVKVVNELPENFRRGQRFGIQRFREMQGSLSIPADSDFPTTIKVLIYNTQGVLLLNKEYEIDDAR